jgi:polar amino acid transport system substrate-binding protein
VRYFLIVLLLFCHVCVAQKVTLGVQNISYYPHYDYTDDRQDSLLEWLLLQIQEDTDLDIDVQALPIKRLDHAFFDAGSIDLIFPVNPNWYPDKTDLTYSTAIVNIIGSTMVKSANIDMTLDDFKVLVVPFGFKPIEWIKIQNDYGFRVFEVPDATQSLNMVLNGRADGADIEYNVARYLLAKSGKTQQLQIGPNLPLSKVAFHFAGKKGSAAIATINQWMLENQAHVEAYKKTLNLLEHEHLILPVSAR